jgi:two-component system LytT family response regulator
MKIVIIEDEKPAAGKLQKALQKAGPDNQVIALLYSLKEATEWMAQNPSPDLLFMDIELTDGNSLTLFERVNIRCPVIFTTAYDEYWQAAFEHNGIDYLLKPIHQEKLEKALAKFESMRTYFTSRFRQLESYQQEAETTGYRRRFLVKRGPDYQSVPAEDIAYFYATHKLVCMVTREGQKFILDQSLTDIEKQVDPSKFYRVNRKYLVQLSAVLRMRSYPKSRLLLDISPPMDEEVLISQENVSAFKEWISR